jgi:hypothetical protein
MSRSTGGSDCLRQNLALRNMVASGVLCFFICITSIEYKKYIGAKVKGKYVYRITL